MEYTPSESPPEPSLGREERAVGRRLEKELTHKMAACEAAA